MKQNDCRKNNTPMSKELRDLLFPNKNKKTIEELAQAAVKRIFAKIDKEEAEFIRKEKMNKNSPD